MDEWMDSCMEEWMPGWTLDPFGGPHFALKESLAFAHLITGLAY
jgi:hypothetical protein